MGVAGLWTEIKPVAVRQSFEKTAFAVFDEAYEALQDGHPIEKGTTLGLRVGIDASAWFIHSEKSEGGANPALRNMFHRVIRLARAGVRALFVFDGPHRPSVKRGHRIYRGSHSIQKDFERIVEAFGFEGRTAPGEAEAELAYLNRRGMLDLVITDDVDCLLFGASTLMKHALINQVTEGIYPQLYERGIIELELDMTVPGLILVALMSGGDYDTAGLTGIGPKISLALARAGYGERLQTIMTEFTGKTLQDELQALRDEIRHEMRTNQSGFFERKAGAVATKFHDRWPDIAIANSYYNAVTSETKKYRHFDKAHLWQQRIDVPALVTIMDDLFEYVHAEILQKLRSQIWECIVVQDLIWKIRDTGITLSVSPIGSPSKVLAATLGSVSLNMSTSDKGATDADDIVLHRIDKKRAPPKKSEKHITDELQLIVDPSPAVSLAQKHLQHPDPNIGKLQARKEAEAAAICALHGPDHPGAVPAPARNSQYDNPHESQKMWIQESLLRMAVPGMVLAWEEREQAKIEAKANKGKKATSQLSPTRKKKPSETSRKSGTPTKPSKKPAKSKAKVISDSESELEDLPPQSTAQDVFSSSAMTKYPSSSSTTDSQGGVRMSASASAASYKRPKERKASSSSSSSDSDIQLVSVTQAGLTRSAKKSPRKSKSQATVRGPPMSADDGPRGAAPPIISFNAVKHGATNTQNKAHKLDGSLQHTSKSEIPKKTYTYRDLVDSDSNSDGDEELPSLTHLLKPKDHNGREGSRGSAKTVSTAGSRSSSSTSIPKVAHDASASTAGRKGKAKGIKKDAPPGPPSQIIDLCSSD